MGTSTNGQIHPPQADVPPAKIIDLLRPELFRALAHKPETLRKLVRDDCFVLIDEIQKIPALLDEVHHLIEAHGKVFGLCGSSARKVRRGYANLLGGSQVLLF